MTGDWLSTLLNVTVFAYLGWLIYLWIRPAEGPLMPVRSMAEEAAATEQHTPDKEPTEGS